MELRKTIAIAVTNDITFDQRVDRITSTLIQSNFKVSIIGRKIKNSYDDNESHDYRLRLKCFFNKGFLFYLEYNIRLFFYLISSKPDIIYACDPDTLLAGAVYKRLLNKKGIYDSHEYFVETPEINSRKIIKWVWDKIEKFGSRQMDSHITVNELLSKILSDRLNTNFYPIRNLPNKQENEIGHKKEKIILYQGVLNKGRALEALIKSIEFLPEYKLWIAGDGDITYQLKQLATKTSYENRISFLGKISPQELKKVTLKARYGYNLLDGSSSNYYYSLANKFFDYMAAGVPSINMNFPLYTEYIKEYKCGIVLDSLIPKHLADAILTLDAHPKKYSDLVENSIQAHDKLHWEKEQNKLIKIFESLSI